MPIPAPLPIAVARAVVGTVAARTEEGDDSAGRGAAHSMPAVVLTLYRQPDGDGTYSLVMYRGGSEGRQGR